MLGPLTLAMLLATPDARAAVHTVGPAGFATIPAAVAAAVDGDIIEVAPGDWSTDLDLYDRELTIRSTGGSAVTRIVGGGGTVMLGAFGSTVTFEGFTFAPTGMRALVVADLTYGPSTVTLRDVVFEGATIAASDTWYPMGSSLQVDEGSSVFLEDVVFASATPVGRAGGHVGVRGSTLEALRTTFVGTDTTNGGSVYLETSTATFTDSAFLGGTVSGYLDVDGVDISGGGALLSLASTLVLVDTTFDDATAAYTGGAAYVLLGSADITGGGFYDNSASFGGGLFCSGAAVCNVDGAVFERNAATIYGGGVGLGPDVVATIHGARLCDNTAAAGGGGLLLDAELTLTNTVLRGNHATTWGGALAAGAFDTTSTVTSRNNSFVDNTAMNVGAAIAADASTIDSTNDLFVGNTTNVAESALDAYAGVATLSVSHALFFANTGTTDAVLDATTLVGLDPLLASWIPGDCAVSDLWPLVSSPVIDSGDPAWLDPDGSISDIGAFGGEGADADFWIDGDGDATIDAWDCAPLDPAIHPAADETCAGIGVDEDCDALVDDDDPSTTDLQLLHVDLDLDGFGDPSVSFEACPGAGLVDNADDCDDTDPTVYAGAVEIPGDGIDQDCDGADLALTDDNGTPDDTDTAPGTEPSTPSRLPPEEEEPVSALGGGCGCDSGGGPGPWLAIAILVGVRRRKRP